ncbi:hypothetical protein M885DRAFT_447392 [Pelagophyceae sp. CCMP2097]|nr:hypothetical protein M885DRAFT_447392 [Pelagophyceae sp. CCMP2097]
MGPLRRLDQKAKEAPAIVEGVEGISTRPRAVSTERTAVVKARAINDAGDWRGTCAICLDLLPLGDRTQRFYACCCKKICKECASKCWQHDERCPLCRTPARTSNAEWVRRVQKHVDKGNSEAQAALGDAYRDGNMGLLKKSEKAVELYTSAARQGHPGGQNALGHCYEHGEGTKVDYKTTSYWYQRAADQGYPDAQCNLGTAFYGGKGVEQSDDEAVKWYRLAAAQGYPGALYNLGACHTNGRGVPRDYHAALRCFRRAAAKGHAGAQLKVENDGHSVAQSEAEAVSWYRLAAAQGDADALFNLGDCYTDGEGVPQDDDEAQRLFKRAAAEGHAGAAEKAAKGVAQSFDEAVKWYRLATAQGNANALFNLGVCYTNGKGVPQDLHEALCLFKRAAAEGHAGAAENGAEISRRLEARASG